MSPMRLCLSLLLGLALCRAVAIAQDDKGPSISGAGGAAGIGQYPPSSWGVTATTITNPTAEDRQLLVTFNFEESPTLRYGVDVWVPANSRRSVWLPMRTNAFEIEEFKSVTLHLQQNLFERRGDQLVELGEARGLLIAARDRWITGIVADGESDDDDSLSAALAMRRAVDLSRRLAYLNERSLPSMVAGWQGLSGLVITKDKPTLDSAQIEGLRQWLLSGGKLWIMIEQVDPAAMATLLGDAWTPQVVDHVPLSTVAIESSISATALSTKLTVDDARQVSLDGKTLGVIAAEGAARAKTLNAVRDTLRKKLDEGDGSSDQRVHLRIGGAVPGDVAVALVDAIREVGGVDAVVEREHERPVDHARVLPGDMEVTHTINGWPAAMRKPVGKGWLLVTTVGPRGWIEPMLVPQINVDGTEAKNEKDKTILTTGHIAHRPLRDLADWFHSDRRSDPLPPQVFEPYVSEQIGKEIVGRGTVLLVLTAFCVALGLAGWWLGHDGRLEHLAWIGAIAAVVVSIVLIVIGRLNQTSVPMTVAQAQFIQVAPDQQQAITTGYLSIYNPGHDDSDATLQGTAGGLILPEISSRGTHNIRMVWTDVDRWHWEGVAMPGGANCNATFERITPLDEAVRAIVTFDENGVTGSALTAPFGTNALANMLIATPAGVMATRAYHPSGGEHGHYRGGVVHLFTATPDDVLPPGRYVSTGVVDDVQRRQQDVYRQLLGGPADQSDDPMAAAEARNSAKPGAANAGKRARGVQFPDGPTLLGWAKPLPLGFVLPEAEHQVGSSLVSIPLTIARPAAGARVTIPSPFLPYRLARGRFGATPPVFIENTRQWNSSNIPGTLPLAFRVPAAVLPMKVTGATFTLDVSAANVGVEVLALRGENPVMLKKLDGATAAFTVEIPAENAQPDENGEIYLIVRLTYPPSTVERAMWRVRRAMLEIKGEVLAADAK